MSSNDTSSPEIIRRKFTLPETLDRRIQHIANQHYQGNVSLCLRVAFQDHESTLTDNDPLSLHRIEQRIHSLETTLQTLAEKSGGRDDLKQRTPQHSEFDSLIDDDNQRLTTDRVYKEFTTNEMSFRIADLADRLEDSPESIVRACEHLIDFGYIIESQQQDRYCLPTSGEY